MDLLEEPDKKKTYQQCKYIVKVWEHKFKKEHKRLPSKFDIRDAEYDVRNAYKQYFKLKTVALENSFKDVEGFDEEEESNINKNVTVQVAVRKQSEELIKEDTSKQVKVFTDGKCGVSEKIDQDTDDVWGIHLNYTKNDETKQKVAKVNSVEIISKKLFNGSKFSKRNPRKSLCMSNISSSSINTNGNNCSLLQPIAFQSAEGENFLSPRQNILSPVVSDAESMSHIFPVNMVQNILDNGYNKPLKFVDRDWLERVTKDFEMPIESSDISTSKSCFKTESIKIDYDNEDIIEDSEEEENSASFTFHTAKKPRLESILLDTKSNNHRKLLIKNFIGNELNLVNGEIHLENQITEVKIKNIDQFRTPSTNTKPITGVNIDPQEVKLGNIMQFTVDTVGDLNKNMGNTKNDSKSDTKGIKNTCKSSICRKTFQRKTKCSNDETKSSEISRSCRSTKVKFSYQEYSSSEQHLCSGTEVKHLKCCSNIDKKEKFFDIHKFEEENEEDCNGKIGEKKIQFEKKIDLIEADKHNSSGVQEIQFSVKPRVVAPRCDNIKKKIDNQIFAKGECFATNSPPGENIKTEKLAVVKNKWQHAKKNLRKKMASRQLNENFIRINVKKKVFLRGKFSRSFSTIKKTQWRSKKARTLYGSEMHMGGCDGGTLICFHCNQIGHFANDCKTLKDNLLPLIAEQNECPLPTLEEASQLAKNSLTIPISNLHLNEKNMLQTENINKNYTNDLVMDDNFGDNLNSELLMQETLMLEKQFGNLDGMYRDTVKVIEPYYQLREDNSVIATPKEVYDTLHYFGHNSFRPGQEQAIMRILSGKSTLVTLSTGSGKSLCYQLPAYLYNQRQPCISLIISPLVSLMDDQIVGITKFMNAGCLHSNQTKTQRQKILDAISNKELNVLLVSPEAVVAGERQNGFGSFLRKLPPVAFACIDEAHCVSQWSHNFRPSYLMICQVLKETLGVRTFLGLTATATKATRDSIIQHLCIPDGEYGVISDIPLPDNLCLTVSKDINRDYALLSLLKSERFVTCKSVIIYCTRREECERIAAFLRTSLKFECSLKSVTKKRKRVDLQIEPYHAGMSASRRKTVQNAFMAGELRIIVATVAFGMGINKSDIQAVIHFNMPSSLETYVQEVGRAGRDGLPAQCHIFLDSQGNDENELRRHIYANGIDRHVIRKLLQKIFVPCSCSDICPKHEVGFSIEDTVRALDMPEENISTLLCYLELHPNKYLKVLTPAYTLCKITSYGGPLEIRKMAKDCPPLAMALTLHESKPYDNPNVFEFPVIEIASTLGWESRICEYKLKNLEWTTVNSQRKRSLITVQFSNLGFRLFAPGNLSDDQLDQALDNLYDQVVYQEKAAICQLHAVSSTLLEIAKPTFLTCSLEDDTKLKTKIREYFNSMEPLRLYHDIELKPVNEEHLVRDILSMVHMYKDNNFTGRIIARILHGIQSPNYPAVIWGRCKFWRSHLAENFHEIIRIATREIMHIKQ